MQYFTNKSDKSKKYKFSICTPCFNSEDTIEKVYESIKNLTYKNFEWVVVNDASSDRTFKIIKDIMSKSDVDIDFYDLNENKMATYCYNLAVKKSQSEFLILLDHDDTIVSNAFERFLFYWDGVPSSEKLSLAGLMSNCDDEDGNLVGSLFPCSPYINGFFELAFDDQVRGEKFFCYKTDIMKNYNFPLLDRYVPESVVMWNISEKYQTLFFNESLRIYTRPQLENNHLSFLDSFNYAKGFRHKFLELLNRHASKLVIRPRAFISFIYNYTLYSFAAKTSIIIIINDLNSLLAKVMTLICLPFAALILAKKKYFN
jgi:glycosyltransferase involved in cell wall biosynthesis